MEAYTQLFFQWKQYYQKIYSTDSTMKYHSVPVGFRLYITAISQGENGIKNKGKKTSTRSLMGKNMSEAMPSSGHKYHDWLICVADKSKNEVTV